MSYNNQIFPTEFQINVKENSYLLETRKRIHKSSSSRQSSKYLSCNTNERTKVNKKPTPIEGRVISNHFIFSNDSSSVLFFKKKNCSLSNKKELDSKVRNQRKSTKDIFSGCMFGKMPGVKKINPKDIFKSRYLNNNCSILNKIKRSLNGNSIKVNNKASLSSFRDGLQFDYTVPKSISIISKYHKSFS